MNAPVAPVQSPPQPPAADAAGRAAGALPAFSWRWSIGGRLLLAFGLIAALTVGATLLSMVRFNQIDRVLHGLIDASIPALKLSMSVRNQATDVIDAADDVGRAADEVERFTGMSEVTQRIADLWQTLEKLGDVVDDATMAPIQAGVGRIDAGVGALDRSVGEGLAVLQRQREATQKAMRIAIEAERAITAAALAADPAQHASLYEARAGLKDAQAHLAAAVAANDTPALAGARAGFDAALARMRAVPAGAAAASELAGLTGGEAGVFALHDQTLRIRATVAAAARALKDDSDRLREKVAAVVSRTEEQAAEAQRRSTSAIGSSRVWLLLIALSSLVLAGLIVWLFVQHYVVKRLEALAGSMLSIAGGNLATPIPATCPDELGAMSDALVVFRDNAREIHRAREEAIKASAEAQAASRAKSVFLANMSHELRTPLNAIIGYSELLAEDAADRGDKAGGEDLGKIRAAGRHLLGLINSVLDLSKIEAGRMDVYLETVELATLVDEVRVIVDPLVAKNGNRLAVEGAKEAGSLRTDLTKLKQSLINLVGNAAKFTDHGDIRLSLFREGSPDGGEQVRFVVADTGIGMNDAQIARLFEPFAQADSSTTRNFGGTGLGLAITRRFAAMLGGSIEAASAQGAGSTFTLVLPDAPVPAAGAAEAPADASALTVLVVDDDPAVHDVLAATLERRGYHVLHAADGAQALEMMRAQAPDVVTLDVMMPRLDGWTVLGRMKSDPVLAPIPVIMLTVVDDRNLGYSLGASEYMTKPVDRERLLELVRRFAGSAEGASVLVVDDDPHVRDVIGATLREAGLRTAEAADGAQALDWLSAHPRPDLVLLDLLMPRMDGFQFLERVRERAELHDMAIVVLTAKELTAEERAFLAERTILVLGKSAQPIGTLGAALAAIATRRTPDATP